MHSQAPPALSSTTNAYSNPLIRRMVGLREIPRTATFAWSPSTASSYLATGTRAGAVDADFSNDTQLELWDLKLDDSTQTLELQPLANIDSDSRFHDIAWSKGSDDYPLGIIAGALENGSLDLWDAEKLLNENGNAHMSRTTNHSGPIKALQFNPFRPELLATAGAKGELFISDLNNIDKAFRMGNAVARADDFECLDWNKKVPHILATGSSGGFVTIWDVKTRKESLTLNNYGRKAASAIAWDPAMHVRLATAVPSDTDPLILVWDLRNSNAPERIIRGHDGGVLSLSWCAQDPDLLLSCGKDNRTIFWNPRDSTSYGELPVVTNWTFETRWNPHNPNLLATASFDGKISVQSIQNTKPESHQSAGSKVQTTDDEDFFSKAQSQPQGASFSLEKAPHWLERPCGASFGFGGKVISFKAVKPTVERDKDGKIKTGEKRESAVRISAFAVSTGVGTSTENFEKALKENDLGAICKSNISEDRSEAEKADWKVIETLTAENPRKALVGYLGFSSDDDEAADGISKLSMNGDEQENIQVNGTPPAKSNRLSAFFDHNTDGDGFLSDLAATKGAKTNNPFELYSGSESEPDTRITRALLLGQFEKALDVCLQENRLSDGFMIAICGGQNCIEKAQKAFFNKKEGGANYLRLLASVVGKNLWDLVYNADLKNWKELMATLCTYADTDEFPDLCEALGDRLEDQVKGEDSDPTVRKDAAFCYLAGSKLEKVIAIWVAEMEHGSTSESQETSGDSAFSIHARLLQNLIEKVTVFRAVTGFDDKGRLATSDWKLAPLYDLYTEYADIVASQGHLQIAERYLDLLPDKYPAAEVAKNRIKQATRKPAPQPSSRQPQASARQTQRVQPIGSGFEGQESPAQTRSAAPSNHNAAAYSSQPQNPYAPTGNGPYGGVGGYPNQNAYHPQQMQQPRPQPSMAPPPTYGSAPGVGPPPRVSNASPSILPPSKARNMSNWNDIPESFSKPPSTSRRGTPSIGVPGPQSAYAPAPSPAFGAQARSTPPLPPPPKGSVGPLRTSSPTTMASQPGQLPERPSSSARNAYAPQQPLQNSNQPQKQPPIARGASPYNAPPSAPPPNNRYAPAPATHRSQPDPPSTVASGRQGPPPLNPYASPQNYSPQQQNIPSNQAPGPLTQQEPPSTGPPPQGTPPQGSRPDTAQSQRGKPKPSTPKFRRSPIPQAESCTNTRIAPGDRTHIPANAQPVYDVLNADFQRVKSRAPATFKAHVNDAEKRLNMLYDHLNNGDLLKEDTVQSMVELAQALQARDYERAQTIHVDIFTNKNDECGNWMVSNGSSFSRIVILISASRSGSSALLQ